MIRTAVIGLFCATVVSISLAKAEDAAWFFEKVTNSSAKFGFSSGFSAESIFISGECGNGVSMEFVFERAALAELVHSDAYPWVRFKLGSEDVQVAIAGLSMDEAGPSMWIPRTNNLSKDLFEKLAKAKRVSFELLAGEKVLDVYKASTDKGRKDAMSRVAKECF